jgi:prepilin-type N-terminal cleavage/methylation domain-containing protein
MKKGFTLTEVLIALSIIGVIAAMTIPNLMISVGKSKTKTQLMKVQADLDQAVQLYEYNGGSWTTALASDTSFMAAFASVMKNISSGSKPITIKHASGVAWTTSSRAYVALRNGMEFTTYTFSGGGVPCQGSNINECKCIVVDLNGFTNGDNKHGSDFFWFSMLKDANGAYSITPFGSNPAHARYPVTSTGFRCSGTYGDSCAAEILGGLDSLY